jgi:ATP-dependent DNA helicase RecG
VANIFKELGLIEQWGSGINRIKKICKKNFLQEPKIEEQNDFVDVEFFRPKTSESERFVSNTVVKPSDTDNYGQLRTIANDYERLAKEEQEILLYLLDNKTISRKEATTLIGLKNTKTYEILNSLVEKNLIARDGQGRSTYYKLLKAVGNE